ncbi:MAG: hypothetical protein NC489_40720 [Ruminococcus flavefaciens]|nr:hypothetical protein [Ruminococcus flavefaciens]
MPYIVKINMCDDTVGILEQAAMHLQEKQWVSRLFFANDYVISGNAIWVIILGFGIAQLNFVDDSIHIYEISCANSVCKAEDDRLWISGKEQIVKWSCQEGVVDSFHSGNLNTAWGEVSIAYDKGILRYKSSLECICIDVQSGRRWKEDVPKRIDDICMSECSNEMLAVFFRDMEKPIFQENDFETLGRPLSMYSTYLRVKNGSKQKFKNANVGKCIYSYLKGC